MSDFSGKTALVTGASRGMGKAVALELARCGAHVIALARTQGALEDLDDKIQEITGKPATLMKMDLRRLDDVDKLGPTILERFGGLDILVGNAGMLGPLTPAHQIAPKNWEKAMAVNFMANVRLVRTLDPLLRASDSGRAVFTTSSITDPLAYWSVYQATKTALDAFVQIYAAETLQTNMKVNLLRPGLVDTALLTEAFPGGYDGELKKPEDIVPHFMALIGADCEHHGEIIEV